MHWINYELISMQPNFQAVHAQAHIYKTTNEFVYCCSGVVHFLNIFPSLFHFPCQDRRQVARLAATLLIYFPIHPLAAFVQSLAL